MKHIERVFQVLAVVIVIALLGLLARDMLAKECVAHGTATTYRLVGTVLTPSVETRCIEWRAAK